MGCMLPILLGSLAITSAAAGADATVIYVRAGATGSNTGASWGDAYVSLQSALAAAGPGDAVWVAAGQYRPAGPGGDRAAAFAMSGGVALYGGFAGTETMLEQRDPSANITILSGDLNADDVRPFVSGYGENSYHVLVADGVGSTAIVDGFTIIAGFATGTLAGENAGGGMLIRDASPTVARCVFEGSLSHGGGAVAVLGGAPAFSRCVFVGNRTHTARGGGVYVASGSAPTFVESVFRGNTASGLSTIGDGGAAFVEFDAAPVFRRCEFDSNTSTAFSPPFSNGGAICSLGAGMVVESCVFRRNTALVGGAAWIGRDASFVNCLFDANTAQVGGGVVTFIGGAEFLGCTFVSNAAEDGGGLSAGGPVAIADSIMWANTATGAPGPYKAQIHSNGGSVDLSYSCVQGVFTPIPGEDPPNPADFPGCTQNDPRFVSIRGPDNVAGTPDDDLRLLSPSAAIDSGRNSLFPAGVVTDLAGAARLRDDPATPDTGVGVPPLIDMGAYEFQAAASCPGDANGDLVVNFADLNIVLSNYGQAGPGIAGDVNADGVVNFADLNIVLSAFGTAC